MIALLFGYNSSKRGHISSESTSLSLIFLLLAFNQTLSLCLINKICLLSFKQLVSRGLRSVGLISSTARGSHGWTEAKRLSRLTTTTPGPSVPSASRACTTTAPRPPAASPPSTRAAATRTRSPHPLYRRRPTPVPICTLSPLRRRRTCPRTPGPRPLLPPGWTRRNLSNTRCR